MLGLWERLYGLAMYSGGLMDWRNSGHPELTEWGSVVFFGCKTQKLLVYS